MCDCVNYLAFGFEIGKISVAKRDTIEGRLRYGRLYGKIDTRPTDNTLIDLVVAVIVTGGSRFAMITAECIGRQFLLDMDGVLCGARLFGQRFGRCSDNLTTTRTHGHGTAANVRIARK